MNALILMTRVPVTGTTKTRLMEILTGEECAEIHRCFLKDLFRVFKHLKEDMDIFITYTPEKLFNKMSSIVPSYIQSFPQMGSDLGERMHNAIEHVLSKGYSKVVLIGADIPEVQPEDMQKAFEVLDNSDMCLGPTNDGGYYLVGMKRSCEDIFNSNLRWGNKSVFENTLFIANELGLSVGLTTKHRDIDEKEDIMEFISKIDRGYFYDKLPPVNTIGFIKKRWSDKKNVERNIR